MSTIVVKGNVILINLVHIKSMPSTLRRLKIIGNECNYNYQPEKLSAGSNYVIVIYLDAKVPSNASPRHIIKFVEDHYMHIKAFLSCYGFPETHLAEIYDVCTDPAARGKRYMREIFSSMEIFLREANYNHIWLGIDLKNPMWDKVLNLYVGLGFRRPKLTTKSPSGSNAGMYVLSLVKNIEIVFQEESQVIRIANKLRKNRLLLETNRVIYLELKASTLNEIKKYLEEPREYAGTFLATSSRIRSTGDSALQMVYPKDSEIAGPLAEANNELFTVPLADGAFSFHTHPKICYRAYQCYIGWPSGQDMAVVMENYDKGLLVHFVISTEGIYSISLRKEFVDFWKDVKNVNCKKNIIKCTSEKFTVFENERKEVMVQTRKAIAEQKKQESKERKRRETEAYGNVFFSPVLSPVNIELIKRETFIEYSKVVNNFTFASLISDLKVLYGNQLASKCTENYDEINENFPIFSVSFLDWNSVDTKGGMSVMFEYHKRENSPLSDHEKIYKLIHNNTSANIRQRYTKHEGKDVFVHKKPVV